jgi:hypothetical protein
MLRLTILGLDIYSCREGHVRMSLDGPEDPLR